MNRLERLYATTEELRRHAPARVRAASLADRFGVSRRTIERDLAALRSAGVAIEADVGRSGGYALLPTRGSVVLTLSPEDAVALLLAARAVGGMPFASAATVAAQRLLDALPPATRVAADSLRERIRATRVDAPPVRPAVQRAVESAVRDRLVVRIHYVDQHGVGTNRHVEAHGFYGAIDGWFLVGWCRLRDAGRIFRLDRITRAVVTTEAARARDVDEVLGWVPRPTSAP